MIETDRLHLRRPTLADNQRLHDIVGPEAVNHHVGGPRTIEDSFGRLLRNEGCWSFYGFGLFTVDERSSGETIGQCGIFRRGRGLGPEFDSYPEAGWLIAETHWGRGYATEAMEAIFAWAATTCGIDRVVAIVSPDNPASLVIAERLGFVETARGEFAGEPVVQFALSLDA